MAEARALKLCTKEDYIKSGQRDDKSPLRGAWFCSRDPFFYMHSCGVRNIFSWPLGELLSTMLALDGLLYIARTALEATHVAR